MSSARFDVGQMIEHRLFGYRGVVFDVDASFAAREAWYQEVARSRPPKDEPWYHVLPDGATHTTYVAEQNLEIDEQGGPIRHPLLDVLFKGRRDGRYLRRHARH